SPRNRRPPQREASRCHRSATPPASLRRSAASTSFGSSREDGHARASGRRALVRLGHVLSSPLKWSGLDKGKQVGITERVGAHRASARSPTNCSILGLKRPLCQVSLSTGEMKTNAP